MPPLDIAAQGLSDFRTQRFAKRIDGGLVLSQAFIFLVRDFDVYDLSIMNRHVVHDPFIRRKQDAWHAHANAQDFYIGRYLFWICMDFSRHNLEIG